MKVLYKSKRLINSALIKICGMFLLSVIISNPMFAQETPAWVSLGEQSGLVFSYQQVECVGHNLILIKVENTTASTVNGQYTITINDGTNTIDFLNHLMDLQAGAIASSSCDEPNPMYTIPLGSGVLISDISLSVAL